METNEEFSCQIDSHNHKKIQFLCLETQCSQKRYLCAKCLADDHKKHHYELIDNLIQKLSARSKKDNIEMYFQEICEMIWRPFYQHIKNKIKFIIAQIMGEIKNMTHQLSQEQIQQFNSLISSKSIPNQLQRQKLENYIGTVKLKLQANDNDQIEINKIKEHIKNWKNQIQQKSKQISSILDGIGVYSSLRNNNLIRSDNSIKKQSLIENHQNIQKIENQECQQNLRNYQYNDNHKVEIDYKILSQFSILSLKENEKIILQKLKRLKDNYIEKLIIQNENSQNLSLQAMYMLPKIKSLKHLQINIVPQMSENYYIRLVQNLQRLEQLMLGKCKRQLTLSQKFIDALIHSNIKKIVPGIDYHRKFQRQVIDINFLSKNYPIQIKASDWKKLSHIPMLETLELRDFMDKDAITILLQMKNIKQLQIVRINKNKGPQLTFINQLSKITQLQYLGLIDVQGSHNKYWSTIWKSNVNLETIFISNTLIFTDNDIQSIEKHCKNLKQLILDQLNHIHGQSIWKIDNLNSLLIKDCQNINAKYAINHIHQLKNLTSLGIEFKIYDDQQFTREVSKLSKLVYLDIGGLKITDHGAINLKELRSLETLICSNTLINGKGLIMLSKYLTNLKRLSLFGLNGKQQCGIIVDQDLIIMSSYLSKITHLSIGYTPLTYKSISRFPNLLVLAIRVKSDFSPNQINSLKAKGVQINEYTKWANNKQ